MPIGVLFGLTDEQRTTLLALDSDEKRRTYVAEDIEDAWDEEHLCQTDKAWDGIHRCLSEFPPHTPYFYEVPAKYGAWASPEDHGSYPLKLCVLGGRKLHQQESEYFIRLVEPNEVKDVATALAEIDEKEMTRRYWKHCEGAWPEYGEDDLEYTLEYFEDVRDFYSRMAKEGRAVIFTADQ